jgi:uncharacterized protein (TIGR04255 family)
MSNIGDGLPRFGKPPVIETVLGVFFRPSEKFSAAQLGIFWDRYLRERFPNLEERPPVEEVSEQFGEANLIALPTVRWQVMDRPDVLRLWARAEDGQHVVQLQKNALFSNWLKAAEDVAYQPYTERRQEFKHFLDHLAEFFREEQIGPIEPTSWAVTYINQIKYEGLKHVGPAVARNLTVWTDQFSDDFLHAPDRLTLSFAFPMPDQAGRLNVNLTPVVLPKDRQQALRLDLTARGQIKTKDLADALSAIDAGHEWVVRGFASMTRPEMHAVWRREV